MSNIKTILKHTSVYGFATIFSKAVGFLMIPVYTNYLRGDGYGIVAMIDITLSFFSLMLVTGLQNGLRRFYFLYKNEDERKKVFSTAVILIITILAIVIPLGIVFSKQIADFAFSNSNNKHYDFTKYIIIAIITFGFSTLLETGKIYAVVRLKSALVSTVALINLTLALSLNIYLIVYLQLGVLGYLYSGLISAVIFSLFWMSYSFAITKIRFSKQIAVELVKFSAPLIPGQIASMVKTRVGSVIVQSSLGLTQLGVFSFADKFAMLINLFIHQPYQQAWGPKSFEICDDEDGPKELASFFTYYSAILFYFALLLIVLFPDMMLILNTPPEFYEANKIFIFLVLSSVLFSLYYQFFFGLPYAKKTGKMSTIQVIAAFISLISNYILIKNFGLIGAGISPVIVYGTQSVIGYFWAQKYYRIPYEWNKLIKILGIAFVSYFILINIDIMALGLTEFSNNILKPGIKYLLDCFNINKLFDGKINQYILGNFSNFINLLLKTIFSFIYILLSFWFKVFNKNIIDKIPILNKFSYIFGI